MMDTRNTKKKGHAAENKACTFLQDKGLTIVERNYSCAPGEIDLIMQDGEDLVFVEVRSRNTTIAEALESIDGYKQAKIVRVASFYLQEKNWYDKVNCRFDVLAVTDTQMEWIKNAFFADNF